MWEYGDEEEGFDTGGGEPVLHLTMADLRRLGAQDDAAVKGEHGNLRAVGLAAKTRKEHRAAEPLAVYL